MPWPVYAYPPAGTLDGEFGGEFGWPFAPWGYGLPTPPIVTGPTITAAIFRVDFPVFADATVYTDAAIAIQLKVAAVRLDPTVWGELLDYGTELYVAHMLTVRHWMAARAARAASLPFALPPGMTTGIATSKSVGGASISYDLGLGTVPGAGPFNLTIYGVEFWQLAMSIGLGAVVI